MPTTKAEPPWPANDLPPAKPRRQLSIDLSAHGTGRVVLNGEDISHLVTKLAVTAGVDHPTRVDLTLVGVAVDGVVEDGG